MKLEQIAELFSHLWDNEPVEVTISLNAKMARWVIAHAMSEYSDPATFINQVLQLVKDGDPNDCLESYIDEVP